MSSNEFDQLDESTLVEILLLLPTHDLVNFCQLNKRLTNVCTKSELIKGKVADELEDLLFSLEPSNVSFAVKMGVDINATNVDGNTALFEACDYYYPDVIEMLLLAGADPSKQSSVETEIPLFIDPDMEGTEDEDINTLGLVISCRDIDDTNEYLVNLLLDAGVNPFIKFEYDGPCDSVVGATPLHVAVDKGYINIIAKLIAVGVDVNAQDNAETTALHRAIYCRPSLEIVKMLLKAGADPNIPDFDGKLPLPLAINWYNSTNDKLYQSIAKEIRLYGGKTVHELWPEDFDSDDSDSYELEALKIDLLIKGLL